MAQETLPLVSIVTPVYNGERYVAETVESVLAQDYPRIEYIVIDDGSTDRTPDVVRRYQGRLRLMQQSNMGQAAALNTGWSLSSGTILGYLSCDDILHPSALRKVVQTLLDHPDAIAAFPNCDVIDAQGRRVRRAVARPFDHLESIVDPYCYIGPGSLLRRSVLDRIGGWKPYLRLAPDREFWLRAGLMGKILLCPEVLACYRVHGGNLSRCTSRDSAEEYVLVAEEFFARTDLPAQALAVRCRALGRAYLIASCYHLRGGRLVACLRAVRMARRHDPRLDWGAISMTLVREIASGPLQRLRSWRRTL
ncbi:MAG: glycosyltransferase [Acidobacteriota bacterium]